MICFKDVLEARDREWSLAFDEFVVKTKKKVFLFIINLVLGRCHCIQEKGAQF